MIRTVMIKLVRPMKKGTTALPTFMITLKRAKNRYGTIGIAIYNARTLTAQQVMHGQQMMPQQMAST